MATNSKFETIDKGTHHFETELSQISDMSSYMKKLNAIQDIDEVRRALDIPVFNANINSPALTGIPTAPTAALGTNTEQIATTAFVMGALSNLVNSAPETLDTLKELAEALGNDPHFSATIMKLIGEKLPLAGGTITGDLEVKGAVSASTFKASLAGNVTGNLTGDVTGNLTGDVTGNVTGDVTGNLTGDVTGNLYGNADTATTASKLASDKTIDGVEFNGTAAIHHFGVCSTAAESKEKVVACVGYKLTTGSRIEVKFSTTNTAAEPTLNVNNTGAKPVFYRGAAIGTGNLAANRLYSFVYNGAQYELVGDLNTDINTAMTQNVSTANNTYPILLTPTANATTNQGAKTGMFASGVKVNPATKSIIADGVITATATEGGGASFVAKGPVSTTHEGGQIDLEAPPGENTVNGIRIDNNNGLLRVFGKASADGTTKTGTGTILHIDPYAKTITGGYTFTGNVTGNVSGSSGSCTGNAATASNVAWSGVTGKPTTISGYGITDAPTKTGAGASGTWGINISGKATTAGTADTAKACSGNAATATTASYVGNVNRGDLVKGTKPSGTIWPRSSITYEKSGTAMGNRIHEHRSFVEASGRTGNELLAYDYTANSQAAAVLGIYKEMGGAAYATAPTPADNDNSIKIATTAWVRKYCGSFATANSITRTGKAKVAIKKGQLVGYKAGGYVLATNTDYSTLLGLGIAMSDAAAGANFSILANGDYTVSANDGKAAYVGANGAIVYAQPTGSNVYVKIIGHVEGSILKFYPDTLAVQLT